MPFMVGCTAQWNGNVPATEKTRLLEPPPGMLSDIAHDPSSRATLCGTVSLFVHVITSPTFALIGCCHWRLATPTATTVVPVESVHGAEAAVVAAGGCVPPPGAGVPPAGACVDVPPPEQAARARAVASAAMPRAMGRMRSSMEPDCARHDSATHLRTSYGSPVGGVRILDPDLARRLVLHEARAQQTPARELRDLGDGWLLHDPSDAEPFWNRLIAPHWPAEPAAFDRRLDEIITLFATLARLPHVRPLPLGGQPEDLARRLELAGFETMGADRRMVLVEPERVGDLLLAAEARVAAMFGEGAVTVTRHDVGSTDTRERRRWAERRHWAADASLVLADAFGVEPARRIALENDVLACISRPGCAMLLLRVDGEPAAIARRASNEEGSYLSSIGTRPAFRRAGLGALATALLLRDALAAGGPAVHLAVESDNEAARLLYEGLGFALVGAPAPDLLLR